MKCPQICLLFRPSRALSSFITYTFSGAPNLPQTRGFAKRIPSACPLGSLTAVSEIFALKVPRLQVGFFPSPAPQALGYWQQGTDKEANGDLWTFVAP